MIRAAKPPASPRGRGPLRATWADFHELSPERLYAVLRLRVDVFVVEQACPYPEIDGRDPDASHLLLEEAGTGRLAAYLRIFAPTPPPGGDGAAHIGRIVTAPDWRGAGLGSALVRMALAEIALNHPGTASVLAAQAHLSGFYASLGFSPISAEYLEDGIPHIDMRRPATAELLENQTQ